MRSAQMEVFSLGCPGGKAVLQPGAADFDASVVPPRWQRGKELVWGCVSSFRMAVALRGQCVLKMSSRVGSRVPIISDKFLFWFLPTLVPFLHQAVRQQLRKLSVNMSASWFAQSAELLEFWPLELRLICWMSCHARADPQSSLCVLLWLL